MRVVYGSSRWKFIQSLAEKMDADLKETSPTLTPRPYPDHWEALRIAAGQAHLGKLIEAFAGLSGESFDQTKERVFLEIENTLLSDGKDIGKLVAVDARLMLWTLCLCARELLDPIAKSDLIQAARPINTSDRNEVESKMISAQIRIEAAKGLLSMVDECLGLLARGERISVISKSMETHEQKQRNSRSTRYCEGLRKAAEQLLRIVWIIERKADEVDRPFFMIHDDSLPERCAAAVCLVSGVCESHRMDGNVRRSEQYRPSEFRVGREKSWVAGAIRSFPILSPGERS